VLGLQASSFSKRMAFIMVPALPDGAYPTFSLAPESDGKGHIIVVLLEEQGEKEMMILRLMTIKITTRRNIR